MGEEKILVAGHLSLDRIKTPDREEDQVPGGAALYTSVAASVYGGTTGLLTTCCSDFPKEVLQRIEGLGIDVSEVLAVLGRQRRSFMEYSEQFERVTHSHARKIWYEKTLEQTPRHLPRKEYTVLVLPPMIPSVQLEYAKWAKKRGMRVCVDTSEYFAQKDRESLRQVLSWCDVFLPSDVELDLLWPGCGESTDTLTERLAATSITAAVIKRAEQGADIYDFQSRTAYRIGIRHTLVKDATGAGDTFNGGFLSAWCRTGDWKSSGAYGAALASLCIESFGFEGVAGRKRSEVEMLAGQIPVEEWEF